MLALIEEEEVVAAAVVLLKMNVMVEREEMVVGQVSANRTKPVERVAEATEAKSAADLQQTEQQKTR